MRHQDLRDIEDLNSYQLSRDLFWESEKRVRYTSVGLTPYEIHCLKEDLHEEYAHHGKKLVSLFGKPKGAGQAVKALLNLFRKQHDWGQGEMVKVDTIHFSVLKHQLVVAWSQLYDDMEGMRLKLNHPEKGVVCDCFTATALMPMLCIHSKLTRVQMKGGFEPNIMETLCPTCSWCIRCGKWLGCTSTGWLLC